jgi:hypothetical protein
MWDDIKAGLANILMSLLVKLFRPIFDTFNKPEPESE